MSQQQNQPSDNAEGEVLPAVANVSRRKLVRAGLAAAPVVAAFKSNMVLAQSRHSGPGVTVRASAFASFQENGGINCSGAPARSTGRCLSLEESAGDSRCDSMVFGRGTSRNPGCGFDSSRHPSIAKKTVGEVLKSKGRGREDQLAKYCAAAYMSASKYGADSYMSMAQCKEIWSKQGSWEPVRGVRWSPDQTLNYFNAVYSSNTNFSSCLTTRKG